MYVKFLNYETITYIKKNYKKIHKDTKEVSFIKLLENYFKINWYKPSKFIKPRLDFVIDKNINPRLTDFQNSKMLYENFKNLTESQASDERFWSGLSIEKENYDYLKYRWGDDDNTIKYRVVYHASGKRGFMYHGLARLWWFSHITYDENFNNPYDLTEFCFKHPHILEKMLYRNYSNSRLIRNSLIKGIKHHLETGGVYKIRFLDNLFNHISALSGVHMIDTFSEIDLVDITIDYLYSLEQDDITLQ